MSNIMIFKCRQLALGKKDKTTVKTKLNICARGIRPVAAVLCPLTGSSQSLPCSLFLLEDGWSRRVNLGPQSANSAQL